MSSLQQRLQDLALRISTECKSLRTQINGNLADLSGLNTANKSNLVAAINELKSTIESIAGSSGATINDALSASGTQTWSINKISSEITAGINGLVAGAPGALDTIAELAAAFNNDPNVIATITAALSNRVRTDTNAQGLTLFQKQNARTNIGAFGEDEIGNPDTNFVDVFNAGLV